MSSSCPVYEGLIDYEDIKQGRGRPARYWKLTTEADKRFPNMHSELTVQLIAAAEQVFGEEGVTRLLDVRQQNALKRYQNHLEGSSGLEEKLSRLVEMRTKEGYMASFEKSDGKFLLNENHCPINKAANNCADLCESELTLFRQLFGKSCTVERNEHIVGDAISRRCSYLIFE